MEMKEWREKLLFQPANGYDSLSPEEESAMEGYCRGYRSYLDRSKTERECVRETVRLAELKGFQPLTPGEKLSAGDKIYYVNRDKAVFLAVIGREGLDQGAVITAAHIDSPRLDLKPYPLYEEAEMAYLKTHYYGGIRKYQWVTIPLELRGVVVLADGRKVDVVIGEGEEPRLVITDLLPHLSQEQNKKPLSEAFPGENLHILLGSRPMGDAEEKDRVKVAVMKVLYEKYGITETDFLSAELSAVPAGQSCDIGIDGSMIGAYGHDDRVCAYAALQALLELEHTPAKTAVCLLVDKEEIGSVGATGMHSRFFENTVAEIMELCGQYSELGLRRALARSRMLSSDVSAAYDPNYPSVFEKKNSSYMGRGLVFNKYTGSRGKSGSNDASAEYMAAVRRIMDDNQVAWQTAELGKVDVGGGGTIAYITAQYGMEVIDSGIPVLNMHAPWEIGSKADIYEATKGYAAFLKDA